MVWMMEHPTTGTTHLCELSVFRGNVIASLQIRVGYVGRIVPARVGSGVAARQELGVQVVHVGFGERLFIVDGRGQGCTKQHRAN